jgi:YidC/Oxa1 family membrane protein insertase
MENRSAFIGIFLIVVVTFTMPYVMQLITGVPMQKSPSDILADSLRTETALTPTPEKTARAIPGENVSTRTEKAAIREAAQPDTTPVSLPGIISDSTEKRITIESDIVKAVVSNRGGGKLIYWELKKHKYYEGGNVTLIVPPSVNAPFSGNGLNMVLVDKDGVEINLNKLFLQSDWQNGQTIRLDEANPTITLHAELPVKGGKIVKESTFYYDRYAIDVVTRFENLPEFMGNRWYSFNWERGLPSTEENKQDDYSYARAFLMLGDELENLDVSEDESEKLEKSGQINWTAIRNKYFLAAIIPHIQDDISVTLTADAFNGGDHVIKVFEAHLGIGFPVPVSQVYSDSFTVYLGPMSISDLSRMKVGLEDLVMNRDWYEELFRPISRWIVLPAFTALHKFIPNYGFVIILFSILVKLLLHPLTKRSYESMSKMQIISPKMTELREKYKNDPQRLNTEMMKLYKEHGVNPLGGCLPMLLQMPLLFALFIVFRSTIQLRGEPFIGWITDLSRPDALALPFSLPLLGDTIHVLPFLMGLTMIWQSRMTVTDPKQKAMTYFMPVFLIFIFYSLPSGLNLYYAVFNLLSMIQTKMIKDKMDAQNGEGGVAVSSGEKNPKGPKGPKKPTSVKEQIAQRRAGMATGNRTQRRQSKKK